MSAKADRARRINLGDANTRRTVTAGQQDAVILRQALERVPYCPPLYRKVAEARIAAPAVPWSVLAASLGMTKDRATGYRRRLLEMAARMPQEPRGGERDG